MDPEVERYLRSADQLPSAPGVALRVLQLNQRDDVSVAELVELLGQDPVLVAKLLRTANSGMFGLPREVSSVRQAVMVLGLRTGRDHTRFQLNEFTDPLKGVTLNWKPSERTELNAVAEQRFFGKGGELTFNHRSPYFTVFARLQRTPTTSSDSLGVLPAGSDLAAALDEILSTRITNPVERAREVQEIIVNRGLSPTLTQALEVFSESAQLLQSGQVTLVLLGARHTAALTVFSTKAVALTHPGEESLALNIRDNRQDGGSLQLSRRLTPQSSVNLFVTGTRIVGLGVAADLASVSKALRVSFDQQLGTRTTTSVGVRRQLLYSSQQPYAQESSVYGTILHRF